GVLALSLELAEEGDAVGARIDLALSVCEKLLPVVAGRPRVQATWARCVASAAAVYSVPGRPVPENWTRVAGRIEQLVSRAATACVAFDPGTFLHLARCGRQQDRLDEALHFAEKGLEVGRL